uniref:Ras modification protein ERF4 n=1 Tax=Haemonchus contortus TaxID=6289 RepID=A0A7I4YIJ4_HAECO
MVMASPPQAPSKNGVTVHEMKAIRLESCRKIFVPRDYSFGLDVHFETQFPMAFRGKISESTWENTIQTINSIFADAEKVCFATILETVLGCATCYCSRLVSDTIYQKKMKKLNEFLNLENQQTYNPAGFHILSPMERGLRTVEIWILTDPSSDIATSNLSRSDTAGA